MKHARRAFRIVTVVLLLLAVVGTAAAIGAFFWAQAELRDRVAEKVEAWNANHVQTLSVSGVSLGWDGTVRIAKVGLTADRVQVAVDDVRVVLDPFALLEHRSLAAVTAVRIERVDWYESGRERPDAVVRTIRSVVKDLRAGRSPSLPTGPAKLAGSLPPVDVRQLLVRTDEGPLLEGRATLAKGPPVAWTVSGTLSMNGKTHPFWAEGDTWSPGTRGAVKVTLERPLTLAGPRGSTIEGIDRLVLTEGRLRTGPVSVLGRTRQFSVTVDSVDVTLDEDGSPKIGRTDNARVRLPSGHSVSVRDVSFDPVTRRVVLLNVRGQVALPRSVLDALPHLAPQLADAVDLRAERVSFGLDDGPLDVRQLDITSKGVSAVVRSLTADIDRPSRSIREIRVKAARVRAAPYDVRLRDTRLTASDNGLQLTVRVRATRSDHARRSPLVGRLRATFDQTYSPRHVQIEAKDITRDWFPGRLVDTLSVGSTSRFDLNVELAHQGTKGWHVTGDLAGRSVSVAHWRIAPTALSDLDGSVRFDLVIDPRSERIVGKFPKIQLGDARASLSLDWTHFHDKPIISATLSVPTQACETIRRSVPDAMIPGLSELRLNGEVGFKWTLAIDMDDPHSLKWSTTGDDLDACEIVTLGRDLDRRVRRLGRRFTHRPVVAGAEVGVTVGPGTKGYLPLKRIPSAIPEAAILTEDRGFREHQGLRLGLIRGAVKLNLEKMRYVYGGSTITQQLVKNLFLTRRKDLSRKLEEAVIVVAIERSLSKDRILELYLNCIEYGPGIWGLEAAAQAYFAKPAEHLTALEGTYLMAIKPYPTYGYWNAKRNKWRKNWVKRMGRIFKKLKKRGAIDEATYAAAAPRFRPTFYGIRGITPPLPPSVGLIRRPGHRRPRGERPRRPTDTTPRSFWVL